MIALPITHADAVGLARAVVFERAVVIAFSPEYISTSDATVDMRRLRCRRVSVRRFTCSYRITMAWDYRESGTVRVTRMVQRLHVRTAGVPTRINPVAAGLLSADRG